MGIRLPNLSYSGFGIEENLDRLATNELRIEILGQSVIGHAKLVQSADQRSGFCFEHRGIETWYFYSHLLSVCVALHPWQSFPESI